MFKNKHSSSLLIILLIVLLIIPFVFSFIPEDADGDGFPENVEEEHRFYDHCNDTERDVFVDDFGCSCEQKTDDSCANPGCCGEDEVCVEQNYRAVCVEGELASKDESCDFDDVFCDSGLECKEDLYSSSTDNSFICCGPYECVADGECLAEGKVVSVSDDNFEKCKGGIWEETEVDNVCSASSPISADLPCKCGNEFFSSSHSHGTKDSSINGYCCDNQYSSEPCDKEAKATDEKVDVPDSDWRSGGEVVDLPEGEYKIEFKDITGFAKPDDIEIDVTTGENITIHQNYSEKSKNGDVITWPSGNVEGNLVATDGADNFCKETGYDYAVEYDKDDKIGKDSWACWDTTKKDCLNCEEGDENNECNVIEEIECGYNSESEPETESESEPHPDYKDHNVKEHTCDVLDEEKEKDYIYFNIYKPGKKHKLKLPPSHTLQSINFKVAMRPGDDPVYLGMRYRQPPDVSTKDRDITFGATPGSGVKPAKIPTLKDVEENILIRWDAIGSHTETVLTFANEEALADAGDYLFLDFYQNLDRVNRFVLTLVVDVEETKKWCKQDEEPESEPETDSESEPHPDYEDHNVKEHTCDVLDEEKEKDYIAFNVYKPEQKHKLRLPPSHTLQKIHLSVSWRPGEQPVYLGLRYKDEPDVSQDITHEGVKPANFKSLKDIEDNVLIRWDAIGSHTRSVFSFSNEEALADAGDYLFLDFYQNLDRVNRFYMTLVVDVEETKEWCKQDEEPEPETESESSPELASGFEELNRVGSFPEKNEKNEEDVWQGLVYWLELLTDGSNREDGSQFAMYVPAGTIGITMGMNFPDHPTNLYIALGHVPSEENVKETRTSIRLAELESNDYVYKTKSSKKLGNKFTIFTSGHTPGLYETTKEWDSGKWVYFKLDDPSKQPAAYSVSYVIDTDHPNYEPPSGEAPHPSEKSETSHEQGDQNEIDVTEDVSGNSEPVINRESSGGDNKLTVHFNEKSKDSGAKWKLTPLSVKNCEPNCSDKECGSDGCGGSCGDCSEDEVCEDFECVSQSTTDGSCKGDHPFSDLVFGTERNNYELGPDSDSKEWTYVTHNNELSACEWRCKNNIIRDDEGKCTDCPEGMKLSGSKCITETEKKQRTKSMMDRVCSSALGVLLEYTGAC